MSFWDLKACHFCNQLITVWESVTEECEAKGCDKIVYYICDYTRADDGGCTDKVKYSWTYPYFCAKHQK